MSKHVIEVRNLHYRYTAGSERTGNNGKRWILENLNFRIDAGAYVLICGASGSGKSTLCRAFNGLIPHFYGGQMEGSVHVAGLDTGQHAINELFNHVALVFQNPEPQLFNSTVERELGFGLESLGLPRQEIQRRIGESAEIAGIAHLLDRSPHHLSGGEQQLTIIAAALALQPEVIVLDEPYASLDPVNIDRVRTALREIHSQGTAIVIAEHRLQHVVADAERMLVLQQGQIVLDGPPRTVLAQNVTAYGLHAPAVVRVAQALELAERPLTVEALIAATHGIPAGVLPAQPNGGVGRGEPVLRTHNLTYSFESSRMRRADSETLVLQDIDLKLYAGECLAVVGGNGAGKTTLIKHFNGLLRPDQGRVVVLGRDTHQTSVSQLARDVGMVFQNANSQFFKFKVQEEIEVAARALKRYDASWIQELVQMFHLEPILERSPYQLSGGEKKRVAFAAALTARPEILVLDEPTTGQDWPSRQALDELLDNLEARGQSIVMVTHDLEFAEHCAQRWIVLAEGQVLANGHPEAVMGNATVMQKAGLKPTQAYKMRQASISMPAPRVEAKV